MAAGDGGGGDAEQLLELFKAQAPAEELAGYDPAALAAAARLAAAALSRHRPGESVIAIDDDADLTANGRALTAITVVNDNMPFLFDSIAGEVNETAGEPTLMLHPVLPARHASGAGAASAGQEHEDAGERVSLIHVHVPRLPAHEAKALQGRLESILRQVRLAVRDWEPMRARLDRAIAEMRSHPLPLDRARVAETIAFLEWLRDDNFTFLGMREYRYRGGEKNGRLELTKEAGLGILTDPDVLVLRRGTEAVTTTPEIRAFLHGPEPIIVTKANAKSVVHRRIYLDYVGVKTFGRGGKLDGELRIVGLFTSGAYTRSVMTIPYLRSKAKAVISKSGFDPDDHSGKALVNVLESFPRDELFQIDLPTLRRHAEAIVTLGDRPRVRVLYRIDHFDRFVSVLVYVPRDRYDSEVGAAIGAFLRTAFDGRLSAYYPAFPEGALARIHFIIGRSGGKTPRVDQARLEEGVRAIVRTWDDALRETVAASGAAAAPAALAARFPASYRNSFSPEIALRDAARLIELGPDNPIAIDFLREPDSAETHAGLKIYHHGSPVSLSRRVPLLENMGFRVISERTFELPAEDGVAFLHDMELESARGAPIDLSDGGALFDRVFLSVWRGESDNDGYNMLAQTAGLEPWRIQVLRAYGRYLQQAGIPQSQDFIAAALNRYPAIAGHLCALFEARLDPAGGGDPAPIEAAIGQALEAVPNLDDDTIIRRFLNLVLSTLRTNHYAEPTDQTVSLALKFDSRALAGLPEPKPWREIFVYGPQVEGVHLRFGPVARGGLRWSDRAQDYRTEVLGLVKAQQVKNAVIVPVGSKGGFFPRQLPLGGSREQVFEVGRAAYVNFISSMLSVTDNIEGDAIVPPAGVVRHDGDDPYFVVAADKGTATFSDTANAISQAHDFWLDDAFASGGSAGYDHKKMGITARGAWEAVKRHFRELGKDGKAWDIQSEPFTAVGVGDMSGDVFGNGMLLSRQTRLVAAFDHRDIFIDPDPDPARAHAERERLFVLPRSSWQDYDKTVLSRGGMVVSRTQKSVTLTPQAAAAIGMAAGPASPIAVMNAILKAPVDLLWFGGIGTYVRAQNESNAEVGDRANDAIRIAGAEIRARVVGEGANLGMTQRGRIEYALAGGRCNSDAIDNSGGVNSSDLEVNIKIALAAAMRSGRLTRPARNRLLAAMTGEVAELVLANNYRQTLAISLAEARGVEDLPHQARMMTALEARGLLDRKVEFLPDAAALAERQARGQPLTRPELGVLLAYAKLVLFSDLVASSVPDEAHFDRDLVAYFPARMAKKYVAEIHGHRLRREIIATELANDAVNRGGPSLVNRLQDLTGCTPGEIIAAYGVVRDGFALSELAGLVDALDNKVAGVAQLSLYQRIGRLVHVGTAWQLRNGDASQGVAERVAALRAAHRALAPILARLLPQPVRDELAALAAQAEAAGVPPATAQRLSSLVLLEFVPDIALLAARSGAALERAAAAFVAVTEAFRIGRIEEAAWSISPSDYYEGLALARAGDVIDAARRDIAVAALTAAPRARDPVAEWVEAGGEKVARTRERMQVLTESGDITVSRLTVAAGLMDELGRG